MRFKENIWSSYLRLSYNDMIGAQNLYIQLMVMFIFWIRFEVFFKANI